MDTIPLLITIIVVLSVLLLAAISVIIYFVKEKNKSNITEEELSNLVDESHESGVLLASEATMIQNIFEFDEKDVKDIMVHRKSIVAIDSSMTIREAIAFITEQHFSRYPVYDDDIEHICGILHIKDLLSLVTDQSVMDKTVKEIDSILSEALFFPETHGINTLFAKMQQSKTHMVIVVDEYGQVCGLLSMEDILEEIVGSIEDEHDEEEEDIEQVSEDVFMMDGLTELERFEEVFGTNLSDDFETLNGFLTAELGKIPDEGSSFTIEAKGYSFEIHDVKDRVIGEISVKKLPEEDLPEKNEE